ncbi:putative nucleotide-diphospho-sugar transferase [Thiohalocapsa marina]|nr:putative nucleotide-diphospho-sugar transferase [Thiohalocapsa marina]
MKMKKLVRLALSKYQKIRAKAAFRKQNLKSGVMAFQRALDLDDNARLSMLNRILPNSWGRVDAKLIEPLKETYLKEGEAYLAAGEDDVAGEKLAAAIVLSNEFSEQRDFEKLISPIICDDHLIVTQVAYNYFPIFEIWHRNMLRLGIENILLIALDPLTAERARLMGIRYWYLPIFAFQKSARRLIWTETLKVRRKVLDAGVSYLHSDADAIWLKDVRQIVLSQDADFVTSIADGAPKNALDRWGFVMCLGFYLCRSNTRTKGVYDQYIKMCDHLGHDQNSLNQIFLDAGFNWVPDKNGYKHGSGPGIDVSATILPERIVSRPRTLHEKIDTGVLHPVLSARTIREKIEILDNFGIDVGKSREMAAKK